MFPSERTAKVETTATNLMTRCEFELHETHTLRLTTDTQHVGRSEVFD